VKDSFLLFLAIVAEVIESSFLRSTAHFTKFIPSIIVIVCYGTAYYCFSWAIRTIPLGIAYSIWCSVGIIVLTAVGIVFYKEIPDVWGIIGISFIFIGVLIVNLFSKME
jgi:small multidrug resistance pump